MEYVLSLFSVRPIYGKFPASAYVFGQRSLCDRVVAQCREHSVFHHSDVWHMLLAGSLLILLKAPSSEDGSH